MITFIRQYYRLEFVILQYWQSFLCHSVISSVVTELL